jgi:trigger factor
MNERLEELKATAHIKGFRPGKVPMAHLKKMYRQAGHGRSRSEIH